MHAASDPRLHPRIGVSTKVFWGKQHDLTYIIHHIAEHARLAEIWTEFPYAQSFDVTFDTKMQREVEEALASTNLVRTVHGPIHEINIASPHNMIRRLSVEEVLRTIDFAAKIGAERVTIHGGKKREGFPRRKSIEIMIKSLDQLARAAADRDVILSLENNATGTWGGGFGRDLCIWPEEVKHVLTSVKEPIQCTLDVAHLETIPHVDYDEYILGLRKWIRHAHVADIREKMHMYMPIGSGTVRWNKALPLLKRIKYKGYFVIEGWINAYQDKFLDLEIENLRHYLREFFERGRISRKEKELEAHPHPIPARL